MSPMDPSVVIAPPGSDRDPEQVDREFARTSRYTPVTLTGLFILAVFFTLHLGRVIFLPLTRMRCYLRFSLHPSCAA